MFRESKSDERWLYFQLCRLIYSLHSMRLIKPGTSDREVRASEISHARKELRERLLQRPTKYIFQLNSNSDYCVLKVTRPLRHALLV